MIVFRLLLLFLIIGLLAWLLGLILRKWGMGRRKWRAGLLLLSFLCFFLVAVQILLHSCKFICVLVNLF